MFYQNSNDLVKNASLKSGNVQHSKETQRLLSSHVDIETLTTNHVSNTEDSSLSSLSFGAQFQNMVQELVSAFSIKEGYTGDPPTSDGNAEFIQHQSVDDKKYTKQELDHINNTKGIVDLIEKEDKNSRQNWVEVTDAVGVTKYGYITKDGVFQIWHAPSSPSANPANWLQTDKMKQNATTVIGCPAPTSSIQKIKIDGKWDDIKPYDLVYSETDKTRTNPVFMMINNGVRDPRTTLGGRGLFSCGNEGGNVYVTERPSADFQFPGSGVDTIKIGCYVLGDKVNDSDLKNRGFIYQPDLNEASIPQCKRRAEDLGSSYFLVSAPETTSASNNRGGCWVYTGSGKPNIHGLMTIDEKGDKCHTLSTQEAGEDVFLNSYTTTNLNRMYGKNTTIQFPLHPPNPECDHTTRSRCIFKDYHHIGGAVCYPKNWNGAWAYGGLYNYSKQDLKGWLQALHDRNADGLEREAVNEYIEKCKRTQGYEILDDDPEWRTKIVRSVALYSLKTGGPTGVDQVNRGGRGYVGRIAYIDHNGERHDYPASALSYSAPNSYVKLDGYDTRSSDSTYGLKEVKTRNKFPLLANMPNWEMNIQFTLNGGSDWRPLIGNMYNNSVGYMGWGLWVSPTNNIHWSWKYYPTLTFNNLNVRNNVEYRLSIVNSPTTMKMTLKNILNNTEQSQTITKPENAVMASDGPVTIGGWKNYSDEKFPGKIHSITIPKMYFTNDPPSDGADVPLSNPVPVEGSVTGTIEQCQQMCDNDENCGGFVYTKISGGENGKCELKDRAKMYPVGLRVSDPTKQLMIKVPKINSSIVDETCKVGNGAYTTINSAHYAHYPDTGSMTSNTKCNIRDLIPKEGNLKPVDLSFMFGEVDKAFEETDGNTTEYRNQTSVPAPQPEMTGNITEGMTLQQKDANFYTDASNNYGQAMKGVQASLVKIANSKYQRERLLAMTEESNKNLISESYKFILWSILAILAVMALLKLKEMFGEDDADGDGGDGGGGGGLLATILGWFGVKSVSTNDIPDRTEDVKSALSSAGQKLSETGTNLATGITEGADNLVNSANNMATGVVEGATNLVDKAKETASNAIDQVGTAASSATSAIGIGSTSSAPATAPSPTTGGRKTSSVSKAASSSSKSKKK